MTRIEFLDKCTVIMILCERLNVKYDFYIQSSGMFVDAIGLCKIEIETKEMITIDCVTYHKWPNVRNDLKRITKYLVELQRQRLCDLDQLGV